MATDPNEGAEESLRDTLDAAFEEHATDEVSGGKPDEVKHEPAASTEQAAADQRARDERGRFAPAKDAAAAPAQQRIEPDPALAAGAQATVQPTTAPQPAGTELKAPGSWRPEAREKWATVDPIVRQEAHRREVEFQTMLQQTAQQRQFVQQFERTVAPYEMFMRDENATPLQAVQNLMQAAATLRIGSPLAKAQLVANIIQQHGIHLESLDQILVGRGATVESQQTPQQQFRDPRMDQFLMQQGQVMRQLEAAQDMEIRGTLNTFATSHEFYADVAATMADIIDVRTKQNQPIDLELIYNRACQMHDGVSTILAQRSAAAKANGNSQAVLRAKRAASSVKSDATPDAGASVPKNDSVRAAIEAAFESQQDR